MAATNKFQLLIEAQARGDGELARMSQSLKNIETASNSTRTSIVLLNAAGDVLAQTFIAGAKGLAEFAKANLIAEASVSRSLLVYKALRIAIAIPSGVGAVAVAAGPMLATLAARTAAAITLERARQVESVSMAAATSGASFGSAFALQRAGAVTGRDVGFLKGFEAEDIERLALKFRSIEDPASRAAEAVRLFGADGAKALETIDSRFAVAVSRAHDLSEELDGPTRVALGEFKGFFDDFHPFQTLGDEFDNFSERVKIGIAKGTVDFVRAFQAHQRSAGESDFYQFVSPMASPEPRADEGLTIPELMRESRRLLAHRLGQIGGPRTGIGGEMLAGAQAAAGRLAGSRAGSRAGVAADLSAAQRALVNIEELFNAGDESQQGSLSETLVRQEAAVVSLTAKLKAMDEALKSVAERESLLASLPGLARRAELSAGTRLSAILGERSDFEKKLGPGFEKQVSAIFRPPELAERKRLMDSASEADTRRDTKYLEALRDQDRAREEQAREFRQQLSKQIAEGEQAFSPVQKRLDIIGATDDAKASREAQRTMRLAVAAAEPGDDARLIQLEFSTRKALAEELWQAAVRRLAFEKDEGLALIELDKARGVLARENGEAEIDKEVRLAELAQRRRNEARSLASDFVGSLQSGDPGSFFKSQGGRLVNQIGTNALQGTFTRLQSTLGGIGAASGFGGLLKGTLFDPQNAKPIDRVATATERTAAAAETTAAVLTGRSVGGVSLPGAAGLPGFDAIRALGPLGGFTSRFSTKLGQVGAGASSVLAAGGLFAGLRSGSIQTGPGIATTAAGLGLNSSTSRAANVAGSTAFVAGAGISAFRDFRRGGAGNILSGTATVLGTAAALDPEPISKAVLAIAAASAAIIGSMLPDPKQTRDKRINELLNSSMFEESAPTQFNMDRFGRGFDQNKRGQYRDMPPIQINISTMDARSFSDNRELIADAVRMSIYEGHGINRAMQEAVLAS